MGGDSTRGREPWKKAQEGQDVIVTSLRLQGEDTEAELRRIETSSVDVVLVHGLTGDPHETWGAKKKRFMKFSSGKDDFKDFWPNESAKALKDRATIWTAGYSAPLFESSLRGRLRQDFSEEGEATLKALVGGGLGKRKIVFVGHSLGGLLIKAILKCSFDSEVLAEKAVVENTGAVIFVATPHFGSNLAARARWVVPDLSKLLAIGMGVLVPAAVASFGIARIEAFGRTEVITAGGVLSLILAAVIVKLFTLSRHLKLLDPNSPTLRKLANDFRRVLRKYRFDTVAFYEERPLAWFFNVVPWWSADPGVTDCKPEPVSANHIEICKLPHAEEIQRRIERLVGRLCRGTDAAVFCELREKPPKDEAIDPLFQQQSFDGLDPQVRTDAEDVLRKRLRDWIAQGTFTPTPLELKAALESSCFDVDKFVCNMWYEARLTETLRELRKMAVDLQAKWPKGNAQEMMAQQPRDRKPREIGWPSLIPFYRALRTIEHAYVGDFLESQAQEKNPSDMQQLLDLVKSANATLKEWCQLLEKLDESAATRWLLLRMECALTALSTTQNFIGYPTLKGPEKKELTEQRLL